MERLTNIGSNGEIWITDNDETRRFGRKETAYKKLAEYEDLEEQGLLLRLPCKIGSEVWEIERQFWIDRKGCKNCIYFGNDGLGDYCDYDDTVFTDRDRLEEKIADDLYEEYNNKTDEEYNEAVKRELEKYEPYWKKVIAIYATN